ncbi:MAG TPA: AbrB family transcriptional regulator [Opitutae bacterium]|nr:AbrB family transcriptional regulator [Opitutae bacterium]
MRVTQKGQVTIPHDLRKRYGFTRDRELIFDATEEGVLLRAAPERETDQLSQALVKMRGVADHNFSTDQIMQMTRD